MSQGGRKSFTRIHLVVIGVFLAGFGTALSIVFLIVNIGSVSSVLAAVVFDSDIVPTPGSQVNIGVSPDQIRSINNVLYFNGQNVGLGTTTPQQRLVIQGGGLQITNLPSSQPTCSAATRGLIWLEQAGAGVADKVYACLKRGDNSYSWATYAGT